MVPAKSKVTRLLLSARIRLRDKKLESLANLTDFKDARSAGGWIGLTPNGSLMSTRDAGATENYALEWDAP